MTVSDDVDARTPASVETRLGTLDYESGYPTPETTQTLYDEMDFQRAVQAYLWAYPAVSFQSIQIASKDVFGTDFNDFPVLNKVMAETS